MKLFRTSTLGVIVAIVALTMSAGATSASASSETGRADSNASSRSQTAVRATSTAKTYTEKVYGFSFTYPKSWSVKKTTVSMEGMKPNITLVVRNSAKKTQIQFALSEGGLGGCWNPYDPGVKQKAYGFGVSDVSKRLGQSATVKAGLFFTPKTRLESSGEKISVPAEAWMSVTETVGVKNGTWNQQIDPCAFGMKTIAFVGGNTGYVSTTVPAAKKLTSLASVKKFANSAQYRSIRRVLQSVKATH